MEPGSCGTHDLCGGGILASSLVRIGDSPRGALASEAPLSFAAAIKARAQLMACHPAASDNRELGWAYVPLDGKSGRSFPSMDVGGIQQGHRYLAVRAGSSTVAAG
jgi:hypothetical protein